MPTLVLQMNSADSALVKNVINLVNGVAFDPGPGLSTMFVPTGTYVGPGFIGTLADGVWTWAPPAPQEEPPADTTAREELAAARVAMAQAAARLDAAEARIG